MSPVVKLRPPESGAQSPASSPLPQLIQTPSGLAVLELQGTINLPRRAEGEKQEISIGHVFFPDYDPDALDPSSTSWMKRVHIFIGQHQRLAGEVKKLPKALAIIRKRSTGKDEAISNTDEESSSEELEAVEIVKYKLVFSNRPEPVGTA